MGTESAWDAALDAEPEPRMSVAEQGPDDVLRAFAEFADLKSPFPIGHSLVVARLVEAAARHAGLDEAECVDLRRAALVHDLGRTGIPNGIWDKAATLSAIEWERVRLHPYLTERILSHTVTLRHLPPLAGSHHERLDGSGYYRQSSARSLPFAARILGAADAYQAMTQERPTGRPSRPTRRRRSSMPGSEVDGSILKRSVSCWRQPGTARGAARHGPRG